MDLDETPQLDRDVVLVRTMRGEDRNAVVQIDALCMGRRRDRFLDAKIKEALGGAGIATSLVAEIDEHVVGFLLGNVYYGEFGVVEPAAVLDVLGVHPDYRGRQAASALIDQLRTNLLGLGIRRLHTQVRWTNTKLLGFFQHEGFEIAQRMALTLDLDKTRT